LGRTDEALKLLTRSLAIQETKLAKDHPDISYTIGNLASLHHDQGRLKEAEALFRRSLSICEARFGKDHFETATMASNLGGVYLQMNRLRDAEAFFQRALQIREARLGKSHAHVGASLAHLAGVFLRSGDLERADEYYRRSLLIAETVYGKDGEQVARIMVRRTSLNQLRGFGVEAAKSQNRALEIHQARLGSLFTYTSEANVYDYLQANNGKLPLLVNLAAANRHEPATTELALTWVLRLRGAVFDSLCRYRKVQQLLPYDADLEEKINRRRSQKAFLANAALAPPSGPDADRIKKQIAAAHVEVEQLDSEMRRTLAKKAPDAFAERETTTVASVRAKLRADSALIEFCHTPIFDFKRLRYLQHHYLAFVLRPNKDAPTLIDLGPAKEIDAQIESLRKAFTDFQEKLAECETADEIKALEKNQEKLFKEKSASLHAKLMAPLAKSIGDAKMLYIVAEAALNRLPFECLVGPDGQYLVERHRCAYLASGRDLLRTRETLAKGTVVFAGPDFKLEAAERLAQAEKVLNKKPTALATRGQHGTTLRSAGFKALPGAAAEAIDIQKNLGKSAHGPVKTYVGADALEEVLKSIPAPRVLHLATHGFFLDREIAPPESTEEMDGAGAGSARKRLTRLENPLLRSGIVLAGANTIGDMDGPSNAEDGWVMAEEIALLNLHGTELVVLSACQTGLGDIKTGEGVQGLRRAFLYAGARTLVTSLFEVPDAETRELMQRFYASMSDGRGTLDALHGAQLGMIESRRKERGAAHPFFWASFVLVGNGD
jgi:CHAT domain-containing protein